MCTQTRKHIERKDILECDLAPPSNDGEIFCVPSADCLGVADAITEGVKGVALGVYEPPLCRDGVLSGRLCVFEAGVADAAAAVPVDGDDSNFSCCSCRRTFMSNS